MTLDSYLALDLGRDSDASRDLFKQVKLEAKNAERDGVALSGDGDGGSASPNLTPAMTAWLSRHVLPLRKAAYSAMETAAGQIKLPGGVKGIIEEIEDDKLKRQRNVNRVEKTNSFYKSHGAQVDKLDVIEREYTGLRTDEGNREAKTPSKWLDMLIVVLIMIPEGFMNYSSFLKLWKIGIVALGAAIVVGVAIAWSGFLVGRFWKAYHFYMHPNDDQLRTKGFIQLGLALGLLTVALLVVGYARYRTVLDMAQEAVILGLPVPNVLTMTLGLLAGNLIVFGIGVVVTYWLHDENPLYAEKAAEYTKQSQIVDALRKKHLEQKIDGIDKGYQQDRDKMLKKSRLMDSQPDFGVISDNIGQLSAKDTAVISLLQDYRNALADSIGETNPDYRFSSSSAERSGAQSNMGVSLAEFTSLPLHLYRCSL